jgi:hypothetical protein
MRECIRLAELSGFVVPRAITRGDLGVLYASLGDPERGMAVADEGLDVAEGWNSMSVPIVMGSRAEIQLLAGDLDAAEATILRGNIERLPGPIHFSASAHIELLRGRLALARGDHVQAIGIADTVIEWLRRLGISPFLPAALLLKANAESAGGGTGQMALVEARSEAQRLGFRMILWRIDAELSGVAAESGDTARATELRDDAKDLIGHIAESIDDPELRSRFLGLPDVAAVRSS